MATIAARLVATALALGLSIATVPAIVRADEASLADKASARDLFNQGVALRNKGDHRGALAKFRAAYELWPSPATGLELGRAHMNVGELIEARERLLETARLPPRPTETPAAGAARTEAAQLAESLATRIPSVVFVIAGAPEGETVRISIDGRELPQAALGAPRKVNPGKHTILARVAKRPDITVAIDVHDGEQSKVPISFAATPGEAPTDTKGAGSSTSTLTWIGFGVAGAGLVAGTITGALAFSRKSAFSDKCDASVCPTSAMRNGACAMS